MRWLATIYIGVLAVVLLAQRPRRVEFSEEQQDQCQELITRHGRAQAVATREETERLKKLLGKAALPEGDVYIVYSGSLIRVKLSDKVFVDSSYDPVNPILKAKGETPELQLRQQK